jgi:tetratricopeptide (TPR) repeat protein
MKLAPRNVGPNHPPTLTAHLPGTVERDSLSMKQICFTSYPLFVVLGILWALCSQVAAAAPTTMVPQLPPQDAVFLRNSKPFPPRLLWFSAADQLKRPALSRPLRSMNDLLSGKDRETMLRAESLLSAGETVAGEQLLQAFAENALAAETRQAAWLVLGESQFRRESWEEAAISLEKALPAEANPTAHWELRYWQALANERGGHIEKAINAYRMAAAGAPEGQRLGPLALRRAGWLLSRGEELTVRPFTPNPDLAYQLWTRALQLAQSYPGLSDSLSLDLAELDFSRGDFLETSRRLTRPRLPSSRDSRWEFLYGRASLEMGALDSTRIALERLMAMGAARVPGPWLDEARVILGWLALREGESDQALSYYGNVTGERIEDLPPTAYGSAVALINKQQYEAAETRLSPYPPVQESHQLFYPWLYGLAFSRFHVEKYELAIENLEGFRGLAYADTLVRAAWSLKGDCYYRLDKPDEAYAAYGKALNILPAAPELLQRRLALAAIAAQRWGAAARLLGDLVVKFPGTEYTAEYYFWRAEAFYNLGRIDSARQNYDRAVRNGADPIRCAYALGWCDYKEGRYDSALDHFDRAAQQCHDCPFVVDLFMRRGNCLFNVGRIEEAADAFSQAAVMTLNAPDSLQNNDAAFHHAWALMRLQEFSAAGDIFAHIAVSEGNSPLGARATYWEGQSLFRRESYADARGKFELVLHHSAASDSMKANATLAVADGFFNLKRYRKALDWYRQLLETPGGNRAMQRTAHESIFECRGALGEWKEAQIVLDALTEEFPESQGLGERHLQVAEGCFRQRRYSDALESYREFLEQGHHDDPRLLRVRYQMAICREQLGNRLEAANAYATLGDQPEFRQRSESLMKAGILYLALDENRKALGVLEKRLALTLDPPQSALTRAHLADAYQQLDEIIAARNEWEKVIAGGSGATDSLRAIGNLQLGRMAFSERDWEGAYHGFSAADSLGIATDVFRLAYWAGESAYRLGDTLRAVTKLETFVEGGETEPLWEATARIRLAECYEGASDFDAALEQYERVAELPLEDSSLIEEANRRILELKER